MSVSSPSPAGSPPPPLSPSPSASPSAVSSLGPAATVTASPAPSGSPEESAATRKATGDSGRSGPVAPADGTVMLGAYLSLSGRSSAQSLALRRKQLGRDQPIVHQFWAWDEALPRTRQGVGSGSTLMISWHGVAWKRINGGGSDKLIAAAARNLARQGRPLLLRWAWEMNGDWFEWGGAGNGKDPDGYVSAWRRIHRIFADEGADNVSWVWSPNWNSSPGDSWNALRNYYPGDDYVDWVGVSGYNFYKESPRTLFTPVVNAYGARKPIIVTETAAIDFGGSTKADWTDDLAAYVRRTPEISALVWFDTDTHNDTNFRVDSTDGALAAYRRMARDAHFQG
ncbi:glycoside hydrolase family 26 protein [Actinoplanes sp. NPDC051494]|uniref:glycoside hydrolase family 26 protein n=1 Tax=Actinoplanes sp. NPDC051494 TaxID=3363907 RepID=UPI0037ABBAD8